MWGAGLGALPQLPLGNSPAPHPRLPTLLSLANLLGWGHPVLCPGDATPVRVCLLSHLHCFPTPACPSCSLALILPVAAVRLCGSLQTAAPHPPTSSTSHPSFGRLVASRLAPRNYPNPHKFLKPLSLTSGRIWGNRRLRFSRKG